MGIAATPARAHPIIYPACRFHPTPSSRAQHERPEDDHAKSSDLLFAGAAGGVKGVLCHFPKLKLMWSILWNIFHICKSFKSCWIRSCYMPPTKPRSARSETVRLWCAMPCGNISGGWKCELVRNATARAICDSRWPMRKREVGKQRPRGRENRPSGPRGHSAVSVCPARQEAARSSTHPQQRHRVSIHSYGCAGYFHDSRRAVGSCSE